MKLKVFVRKGCARCPAAREVARQFDYSAIYDLNDMEGLAEAAFHSVLCTPSFILVDAREKVIASWRDRVPRPTEVARAAGVYTEEATGSVKSTRNAG